MINERKRPIFSICLKLTIIVLGIIGLLICYFKNVFSIRYFQLLNFGVQSSLLLIIVDLILLCKQIRNFSGENYYLSKTDYLIQQIFTVTSLLSCLLYILCLVLNAQGLDSSCNSSLEIGQILLYLIVPVLSIVDLLGFTRNVEFKKKSFMYAILPVILYVALSTVGYYMNWNFGNGHNYPYFFLNFSSPVGLVGFGRAFPYFMGSLYWIVLLILLDLLISYVFIKLIKGFSNRLPNKI